jgi:hypothetical protein
MSGPIWYQRRFMLAGQQNNFSPDFFQQSLQSILVLEPLRLEMSFLGIHDVRGE